eukprot:101583-Rhodomonas_salina.1
MCIRDSTGAGEHAVVQTHVGGRRFGGPGQPPPQLFHHLPENPAQSRAARSSLRYVRTGYRLA